MEILTEQRNCETHGDYEARGFRLVKTVKWAGCPKCEDIRRAEEAKKQEEAMERERKAAWMRRLNLSGIPERFHDRRISNYTVESPEMAAARDTAKEYAQNFDEALEAGRSMIFCGNVGTGKTHLATAIGMAAMNAGKQVAFTTVMGAIRAIRQTWRKDSERSECEAINAFSLPDLLILDEVGQQYGSDGEKVILFDIINSRYERQRPSLLISNLDVDGVRDFIGERAFDRLREGGGKVVVFDWGTYRKRVAA